MWITDSVDLPDELVTALEQDQLVIFAGAGTSMSPPSSLPSFHQLAHQIAQDAQRPSPTRDDVHLDEFLGRLEEQGVPVRERTAALIGRRASRPNSLHTGLLRVASQATVRLVTTNYDLHFETAARRLGLTISVYRAPALPLGDQFAGIVHLHGALGSPGSSLVLTDRDFGEAYITDGWAARFLVRMFTRYTVLFIGYSHQDTVMRYLARALPPGTQRYALSATDSAAEWAALGISGISYPWTPDHRELTTAVDAWARQASTSHIEHEARIRELVSLPPPQDPINASYLARILLDATTLQFFVRHARGIQWLAWVVDSRRLEGLFEDRKSLSYGDQLLANWLADHYVVDHVEEVLDLLRTHGMRIQPHLWHVVARRLQVDPEPSEDIVNRWVVALIQSAHSADEYRELTVLLDRLVDRNHLKASRVLFGLLMTPQARMLPRVRWSTDDLRLTDLEVNLPGDAYWLTEAWEKLRPSLTTVVGTLASSLAEHLSMAYQQMQLFGKASKTWDPYGFRRSSIEAHEQNSPGNDLNPLIDATRDCLLWFIEQEPEMGKAYVYIWLRHEAPLLRRIALTGLRADRTLSSDDKLQILLQQELLFANPLKHEVFAALQSAYPDASEATKRLLLEEVMTASTSSRNEETATYERYNLLVWLASIDPSHSETRRYLDEMQARHPAFEPREQPDFGHWVTVGWTEREEERTSGELLDLPSEQVLDRYADVDHTAEEMQALLHEMSAAAAHDATWAVDVIRQAGNRRIWDAELWDALLAGLSGADELRRVLEEVLPVLEIYPARREIVDSVSRLLEAAVRPRSDEEIPLNLLRILSVASRYWHDAESPEEEAVARREYLQPAINHWSGRLLLVAMQVISDLWRGQRGEWGGLPDQAKLFLAHVCSSRSDHGLLGVSVLAGNLHFLHAVEQSWAEAVVVPILNWARGLHAVAAWDGFLIWGRWNEPLLTHLADWYADGYSHVKRSLPDRLGRLLEHLALIFLLSSNPRIGNNWIDRFVVSADAENQRAWAMEVSDVLKQLDSPGASQVWIRRLNPYWTRRLDNVPKPLDSAEVFAMLTWLPYADEDFPRAAQFARRGPRPSFTQHWEMRHLIGPLTRTDYPGESAALLAWLLSACDPPFWYCAEAKDAVITLRGLAANEELRPLIEQLARLGCEGIEELLD
jgi:SIR2-like domain/Domain of unknown function (DUF4020)